MAKANGSKPTRRDFLRLGALSAAATWLPAASASSPCERNCILLFLVGGPSHLDTWDMKPAAPESIRGPFRPMQTTAPGLQICEHFPRMAQMADQFAIVRSVHHRAAAIHETGQQLMQTGWLSEPGLENPHYGSVISYLRGSGRNGAPPFVILPGPIGNTGASASHGQSAGFLPPEHQPLCLGARSASKGDETRYGPSAFGRSCLQARQLIERGVRFVTVNMFDTVFGQTTWDCHADGGALASDLNDYRDTLCPMFDLAYSALLDDLHQRGLLDTTLVVAMGEFGRTPQINNRGGRDHHPGCWSILFAGGGIKGGQVIGSSDREGAEPRDRPVTPTEVAATIYHALGVDLSLQLPGPGNRSLPIVEAKPIVELF